MDSCSKPPFETRFPQLRCTLQEEEQNLTIPSSNIPAEIYDTVMFRRLIDINLTGSFLVSQAVGKALIAANKPGSIVLVASMSGSIVNYPQEQSCYNASKAGVIQLGKSLGAEWAKYNIRVNCISPGKLPPHHLHA